MGRPQVGSSAERVPAGWVLVALALLLAAGLAGCGGAPGGETSGEVDSTLTLPPPPGPGRTPVTPAPGRPPDPGGPVGQPPQTEPVPTATPPTTSTVPTTTPADPTSGT